MCSHFPSCSNTVYLQPSYLRFSSRFSSFSDRALKMTTVLQMTWIGCLLILLGLTQNCQSASDFVEMFKATGFPQPSPQHAEILKKNAAKIEKSGKFTDKKHFAMFFAHIIQVTGGLQHLEEKGGDKLKHKYTWALPGTRVNPNKSYHGRGPMQLTQPQNYHDASIAIFGNPDVLIDHPERVLTDKTVGWEAAAWFWGARVADQPGVKAGKFGAAIKAINGGRTCPAGPGTTKRKEYYSKIYRAWKLAGTPDNSGC